MASPDGRAPGRPDADGVRVERRPARAWDVWLLSAVALALVGWVVVGRSGEQVPDAPLPTDAAPSAGANKGHAPVPGSRTANAPNPRGLDASRADPQAPTPELPASGATLPRSPHRQRVLARRLARQLPRTRGADGKPEIAASDAIAALQAAGVRDGIAAFPPPGTDPPKSGVIVPDDFPLPEGFIRHHQSTDDGKALPPILLVHPDYELIGPDGAPVPLGPDRVVPPELVPDGMTVEMLEVPAPGTGTTP